MQTIARLCAVACAMWLSTAGAAETAMSGTYAGTVTDQFYLDSSGNAGAIILAEAMMKGTFGASRLSVMSKFAPDFSLTTCTQGEIPLSLVFGRSITTFENDGQLFATYDSGWICVTPGPAGAATYRGRVEGHIIGGTGRFVAASGDMDGNVGGRDLSGPFVVNCSGCAPDVPFPGYGSFVGSIKGTLVQP